jgi:malonate transporter and related proteins
VSGNVLALLPVFALIALGAAVARTPLLKADGWQGLERLNYWILFPALLFESIVSAKLEGGEAGRLAAVLVAGDLAIALAVLAARPALRIPGPAFSSVFQGSVRWNGYVGLGICASLLGDRGLGLAAVCTAVLVPLNNLMSVYVLTRFAGAKPAPWSHTVRGIALNPLILATVSGGLLLMAGVHPPQPLLHTLELLGQATIALGLLCVGAAMDLGALRRSRVTVALTSAVKLMAAPAAIFGAAMLLGLRGDPLTVAVVCTASPLATSAYILARQLGGDAALAANLVTASTLLSLATLPLVIALVT